MIKKFEARLAKDSESFVWDFMVDILFGLWILVKMCLFATPWLVMEWLWPGSFTILGCVACVVIMLYFVGSAYRAAKK